MIENYEPRGKTKDILDRAWELVNSVPYTVSTRWLFYRLLQEGFYSKKSDYRNKFVKAVSAARKSFYEDWRPWTLADETREVIARGRGDESIMDWLKSISEWGIYCHLDKWYSQSYYVELWYEARAMTDQFKHYTRNITLVPMGGQPSIAYKWELAKNIENAAKRYGVPIVILYFGDLDKAGENISRIVEEEVRKWCSASFDFIRCGLTQEQVDRYGIPENPEKPDEYQWEALPDGAAKEIITSSTGPYLHQ